MKKVVFSKKCLLGMAVLCAGLTAFSYESGMHLILGGNFGGSFTTPQLTRAVLNDLNPLATSMQGTMSTMLAGANAELGYIFSSDKFDFIPRSSVFSGFGIFFALGVGQGSSGQKITATEKTSGSTFDIFMIVDFLPVIDAGITTKVYFFERLGLGLNIGTRMIADMNPQYLLYTTLPDSEAQTLGLQKQVGTIIVTEDMMKKMNPFSLSLKCSVDYSIPLSPAVELMLGAFGRYNWYRPMYLTMPSNLRQITIDNGGDPDKAQPDYWLNSLDFGVTLSFSFRLQKALVKTAPAPQIIRRSYEGAQKL